MVKNPPANAGLLGLIPELEKAPGEGRGYPLQYSGLENYMDCIIHGVAKIETRLSDFNSLLICTVGIIIILPNGIVAMSK